MLEYENLLKRNETFERGLFEEGYRYSYDRVRKAYRIVIEDSDAAKRLMRTFDAFTSDIEIIKGTMDDVFLNVTGRNMLPEVDHAEHGKA